MKVSSVPRIAIAEADRALAFMMAETFSAAGFHVIGCVRSAESGEGLHSKHGMHSPRQHDSAPGQSMSSRHLG